MILRLVLIFHLATLLSVAEEASVQDRVQNRDYPSLFQAWNNATPIGGADTLTMQAMHDLIFVHPSMLGLQSQAPFEGIAFDFTQSSVAEAKSKRAALLAKNPHLVLLAEIRYRDAPKGFIPENSAWWKRDAQHQYILGWPEGGYRLLDVENPEWHIQVARRAQAVMDTGLFDGVMLDWWTDDEHRFQLLHRIREVLGSQALVLVNSNDNPIPRTAEMVNGLYMECYRTQSPEDWTRISKTLRWAETHLRSPQINCLEAWYHQSRQDLNLMRAVTTLSLTHSDGYALFADPNDLPTPDHLHDWYPFWNKGLGKPEHAGFQRPDGAWERNFSKGTVLYNPAGNSSVTLHFKAPRQSRATGQICISHTVPPNDGDIFLKP